VFASEKLAANIFYYKLKKNLNQSSDYIAIFTVIKWETQQPAPKIIKNWKGANIKKVKKILKILLSEPGATKVRKTGVNAEAKRIKKNKTGNKRTNTEYSYNGQNKPIIKLKI